MSVKVAYILVSSDRDIYLEQALVSMYSLRKHNQNRFISLVVDKATHETLIGSRAIFLKYVDELIVVELDVNIEQKIRSRMLKTNLRNLVNGDFLFVDCDTVFLKNIDEIDLFSEDMLAVHDCHSSFNNNPHFEMIVDHLNKLSTKINIQDEYFNSGVIYVKDNEKTRRFYQDWNELYLKNKYDCFSMDQPSFFKANRKHNIIKPLSGGWNCQLKYGVKYFGNIQILHYLATNKEKEGQGLHVFQDEEKYLALKKDFEKIKDYSMYMNNVFDGLSEQCLEIFTGDKLLRNYNNKNNLYFNFLKNENEILVKLMFLYMKAIRFFRNFFG